MNESYQEPVNIKLETAGKMGFSATAAQTMTNMKRNFDAM